MSRVGDGLLDGHDLLGTALPLSHLPQDFLLTLDGLRRGELSRGTVLRSVDKLELAGGQSRLHAGANLRVGRFAHAAPQGIAEEGALVGDSFALEAALACKSHGLLRGLLRFFRGMLDGFVLAALSRLGYNLIRLISELGGQLAMRREDFGGRLNLLLVARGVGGKGNYSRIGIARVVFSEAGDPTSVETLGIALEHFRNTYRLFQRRARWLFLEKKAT